MTRDYLARRLIQTVLLFIFVVTVNFVLPRLVPGDPAARFYEDPRVSPEIKRQILHSFGLDRPVSEQYLLYLGNLVKGDFGVSYTYRRPVMQVILERIPWTIALTGASTLVSLFLGIIFGALAAWKRGSAIDAALLGSTIVLSALPSFWFAMLLLLAFAFYYPVLPAYGMIDPGVTPGFTWEFIGSLSRHAFLPVLILSLMGLVGYAAVVRYSMIDVIGSQYIVVARSKGVPEWRLLYKHALRNALLPLVTRIGMGLAGVIGGAVVIETIFSWEGMGLLVVEAARSFDYPLMQGAFLILATLTLLGNLGADLLYARLDPRVKLE